MSEQKSRWHPDIDLIEPYWCVWEFRRITSTSHSHNFNTEKVTFSSADRKSWPLCLHYLMPEFQQMVFVFRRCSLLWDIASCRAYIQPMLLFPGVTFLRCCCSSASHVQPWFFKICFIRWIFPSIERNQMLGETSLSLQECWEINRYF